MSLVPLLEQAPTLQDGLVKAGVTPVALYLLSPREDDLTILDAQEAMGFQPTATALIMNTGTMAGNEYSEFDQVRRNSTYRRAVARGAVEIWMPRHQAAKTIEDWKLALLTAPNHEMEDGSPSPLGLIGRSQSYAWLQNMEKAFTPIISWLP
jgi:hypothetical protein